MNILIAGLGLIGGSLCKALKKYTNHCVIGHDINSDTEAQALADCAVDEIFDGNFSRIELIIVALYPEAAEEYLIKHSAEFAKGTLITDVCGIKGDFSERAKKIALGCECEYIGIHPMAGKEFGGYSNSTAELFRNANVIIAPFEDSSAESVDTLSRLAVELGAGKLVVTSPQNHDKMIAYTSQLAHVVSSAYVKSPELELECGFSGGSFQDMTRIATMNENMWTDLFMQNRDNLKSELDRLIENLKLYSEALDSKDYDKMRALIKEGRELKEENLRRRIGQPN